MDELIIRFEEGTVNWFASGGQSFGYIDKDKGGQIYVHYKNIMPPMQRDPSFMNLMKDDRVKFKEAEGFRNDGTQAVEVEIISYGNND